MIHFSLSVSICFLTPLSRPTPAGNLPLADYATRSFYYFSNAGGNLSARFKDKTVKPSRENFGVAPGNRTSYLLLILGGDESVKQIYSEFISCCESCQDDSDNRQFTILLSALDRNNEQRNSLFNIHPH